MVTDTCPEQHCQSEEKLWWVCVWPFALWYPGCPHTTRHVSEHALQFFPDSGSQRFKIWCDFMLVVWLPRKKTPNFLHATRDGSLYANPVKFIPSMALLASKCFPLLDWCCFDKPARGGEARGLWVHWTHSVGSLGVEHPAPDLITSLVLVSIGTVTESQGGLGQKSLG